MKTIAIVAEKGGVGKTTLATHLAVHAQSEGQRTVIIDLDPQASARKWGCQTQCRTRGRERSRGDASGASQDG